MARVTGAHLTVDEKRLDSGPVLALTGEIDMATAGELRAAAGRHLGQVGRLVLEFSGVTFCDSQGLSTLISLNRQARDAGTELVLANVSDFMSRLLEITGLGPAFTLEGEPA
jgi:anti-anti-sigma factor